MLCDFLAKIIKAKKRKLENNFSNLRFLFEIAYVNSDSMSIVEVEKL